MGEPQHGDRPSESPQLTRIDEETPLLPKVSVEGLQPSAQENAGQKETKDEWVVTSKLVWIMLSVWIGTFCAGLGTYQCPGSLLAPSTVSRKTG